MNDSIVSRRAVLVAVGTISACTTPPPDECSPADRNIFVIARCSSDGYQSRQDNLARRLAAQEADHHRALEERDALTAAMRTARAEVLRLQSSIAAVQRDLEPLYVSEGVVRDLLAVNTANAPAIIDAFRRIHLQLTTLDGLAIPPTSGISIGADPRHTLIAEARVIANRIANVNTSAFQAAVMIAGWLTKSRVVQIAAFINGVKTLIDGYVQISNLQPSNPGKR